MFKYCLKKSLRLILNNELHTICALGFCSIAYHCNMPYLYFLAFLIAFFIVVDND